MCLSLNFFFNFLRQKNGFFNLILCQKCFHRLKCFKKMFFAHENMKKPASKVAEPAQILPKSQFLFHKNLPPQEFSIMTLPGPLFLFCYTIGSKLVSYKFAKDILLFNGEATNLLKIRWLLSEKASAYSPHLWLLSSYLYLGRR